jgi:hypothetical protein
MKVRELYVKEDHEYIKDEHEDLRSIIGGVVSMKGRIHLKIGDKLNNSLDKIDTGLRKNDLLQEIAKMIDQQIHKDYKLWPSNYYAYDLQNNTNQFADKYTQETIKIFNQRLKNAQEITDGDHEKAKQLFINLYANPVVNQIN